MGNGEAGGDRKEKSKSSSSRKSACSRREKTFTQQKRESTYASYILVNRITPDLGYRELGDLSLKQGKKATLEKKKSSEGLAARGIPRTVCPGMGVARVIEKRGNSHLVREC